MNCISPILLQIYDRFGDKFVATSLGFTGVVSEMYTKYSFSFMQVKTKSIQGDCKLMRN